MRALILDPETAGLEEILERRRRSGIDRLDEVWEGVLHMVPAPTEAHARIATQLAVLMKPLADRVGLITAMHEFNVGEGDHDYRIPDGGLHRESWGTWAHTAALVIEIVSPGDESWEKLPFYAVHGVDEVLIVDPQKRSVHWLGLSQDGEYREIERSALIELGPSALTEQLDWPPLE